MLSALNRDKTRREQQVIVLVQVLAHEINSGYKYSVVPVESFNGVKVSLELKGLFSYQDGEKGKEALPSFCKRPDGNLYDRL